MPTESIKDIRKRSEAEYQDLVKRIADRVWEIMKQNARQEKERRGADRKNKA